MNITETEAREIVGGIQSGDVDEVDLLELVRNTDFWIGESQSYTATRIRAQRWARDVAPYV
jgi:hypothetical protein